MIQKSTITRTRICEKERKRKTTSETNLLLLFIYEVKLHLLQVIPEGLVLKLTTKAHA